MRAREKMLGTLRASAAPASFEDTMFNVSAKTQEHHAQARSLEPLPRSSFTPLPSLYTLDPATCTLYPVAAAALLLNTLTVHSKFDRCRDKAVAKPKASLKFDNVKGFASQSTSVASADDQGGRQPPTSFQLTRRTPFPSAPAMYTKMETVDNHGPHSFDLIPLPRRGNATHGPQSFDLIPLPHRGNTTRQMPERSPTSSATAPWMRQGQEGASSGEYAFTDPPAGRSLSVKGSSPFFNLAPVVTVASQRLQRVGSRGGAV